MVALHNVTLCEYDSERLSVLCNRSSLSAVSSDRKKKKEKDSEAIKNFGLFLVPKLEAIRSQASVKHPLEAFHLASLFRLWSYSSFDECPPTISKAAVHVLTTRQRWQRMVRFQLKRKREIKAGGPLFR